MLIIRRRQGEPTKASPLEKYKSKSDQTHFAIILLHMSSSIPELNHMLKKVVFLMCLSFQIVAVVYILGRAQRIWKRRRVKISLCCERRLTAPFAIPLMLMVMLLLCCCKYLGLNHSLGGRHISTHLCSSLCSWLCVCLSPQPLTVERFIGDGNNL